MDFINGNELLDLCQKHQLPVSAIMRQREVDNTSLSEQEVTEKLKKALRIMKTAAHTPLENPQRSMGGLIGGEAKKLYEHQKELSPVTGSVLSKAICYSMAVLEVNASMGTIVAAPTAGSSGVLPGVLLALQEEQHFTDEQILNALLCGGAIGCLLMLNSSVSGAEAGCQAEIGSASAMAAAAVTELLGGTPEMALQAAALALSNMLGLVCDPIAGLVEAPCQSRNAMGAANAITCAHLALCGICHPIPFDEMAAVMRSVGNCLPRELRETALGGCAATPTGQKLEEKICSPHCEGCS
ncbi:MAG: L-serine ammonia-lyase, iron-sulfur-dependent, subunit alpha [Lachnospiraceae bacterium]|nr:L-serine ammonia-lyase, iron-sulfur-dependent, subunit alpha [Lachnospiraceae bacterium]